MPAGVNAPWVYVVHAYHGPDFPMGASWDFIGVFSTEDRARDYAHALMWRQDPDDPLRYAKANVRKYALDVQPALDRADVALDGADYPASVDVPRDLG